MHMLSRKDLNSAELETVRVSRNPTSVITADGEVQTNEDATVYVHDLDLFATVQILEDTPAVLSLEKLCEDHGYSHELATGQKPHLMKTEENTMQHEKTTCLSMSQDYQPALQDSTEDSTSSLAKTRRRVLGDQLHGSEQSEDENKDIDLTRGNLLQDLPERLEDFTENLVDEGVSASRDAPASTSRE